LFEKLDNKNYASGHGNFGLRIANFEFHPIRN